MMSFMPEIYAMIASAVEIWVICNEYKLTNFIAQGSFRCISSQFSVWIFYCFKTASLVIFTPVLQIILPHLIRFSFSDWSGESRGRWESIPRLTSWMLVANACDRFIVCSHRIIKLFVFGKIVNVIKNSTTMIVIKSRKKEKIGRRD